MGSKKKLFWFLDFGNMRMISQYRIRPEIIETTVLYFLSTTPMSVPK